MRLFVAINLPAEVKGEIWRAAEPLRVKRYPVRWVAPESIHLTLKFLGEVDAAREPQIVGALLRAVEGARRFRMLLSGFGAFPSVKQPRVLWVGCEGVPSLELLQHQVELEMEQIGFPLEGRPFRPHLTLGRVARGAKVSEFRGLEEVMAGLSFAADVVVESADLMESHLTPQGARYVRRHAAALAP
ncbi:MAG: RNA 2',3'-cyclic phosphodiesterase [Gemmatimonadales bacterium]|nr:RNA 2',3'-cyclic phosphodiesterase [bacterium HR33]GIW51467.1 MAG: RNA 2',3'-cyclic phosphodiesterase [Gemmatimonadales bacterium]